MEFKELDYLIKKYFDGESSLEEEALIHRFFREMDILPEKYKRLKAMFGFYETSRNEKSELQFVNLKPKNKKNSKNIKIVFYAVAASIALLFGIWFLNESSSEKPVYAYINGKPIENQDVAYKEAQKALLMISRNLNEGAKNVNHLSELNKAVEIIRTE